MFYNFLKLASYILILGLLSFNSLGQTTTFNFTGGVQSFTVPACVTSIQYSVQGAKGGGANAGNGSLILGTLMVTPGQILQIRVGGQGTTPTAGYNGGGSGWAGNQPSGGGGGASDIRLAPFGNANRIIVAAGGGGRGGGSNIVGGGLTACPNGNNGTNSFALGGGGATTTVGGAGGNAWGAGINGVAGTSANGGNGGNDINFGAPGGGGGGGLFGGGGGGGDNCCPGSNGGGGGGAGSSLIPAGAVCTPNVGGGNGTISITVPTAPTSTITTSSTTICHGSNYTIGGSIIATGAWTLTLNNGQTTTGSGNGTWSIVVSPSSTMSYNVTSIVDAVRCNTSLPGTVTLTLPPAGTTLSLDNENATCLVNQNGWIDFYHSSGRLIASVNSLGQNLGNVMMTSYVDVANQVVPACTAPANPSHFTAVMQRHWVITPTTQPSTPVLVRLPFQNTELTTLTIAAGSNSNTNDDLTGIGDVKLSKYSGPNNIDNNAANNCITAGGNSGTTLHTQSGNGLTTIYSAVTGASFTTHSIPSFSEFWLHGSTSNSPLPITLSAFDLMCENNVPLISWTTSSEQNTSHFELLNSINGYDWETISILTAAGNSSTTKFYKYLDVDSRNSQNIYYKLLSIDLDGSETKFPAKSSHCSSNEKGLTVYPNPASNSAILTYPETGINSVISITGIHGEIVKNISIEEATIKGMTIDISDLAAGYYFVRLKINSTTLEVVRLTKN